MYSALIYDGNLFFVVLTRMFELLPYNVRVNSVLLISNDDLAVIAKHLYDEYDLSYAPLVDNFTSLLCLQDMVN